MDPKPRATLAVMALALATSTSCQHAAGRFPLAPARWVDDDRRPLRQRPADYWSPLVWDAADHTVFRPLGQSLALSTGEEAVDVNALDEVPDSSWYQNRLAVRSLTPDEISEGACAGRPVPDAQGPWTVTAGKSDGATPGFIARGPDGQRYIVKVATQERPEISEGADAIGSRLFWAAGYNTPCDRVARIARDALRLDPRASYKDPSGDRHPLTPRVLDALLAHAARDASGRIRVGLSLFLPGVPLGPFRYEDTRADDPNDRVAHEDRRELRAARVLSAWLNHWDSREQNTLATWVPRGASGGYVAHYFIDFSDIVGGYFPSDRINRQLGFSYYFDPQHVGEDFVSLGLIDRPWQHAQIDPRAAIFGYFRADNFVPDQWRGGYPNPAFERMTERDAAWMARILSRMDRSLIAAAVRAADFSRPEWTDFAVRTLVQRRARILERYLTRVSPLADLRVHERTLCALDRAQSAGVYPRARYGVAGVTGFSRTSVFALRADARGNVCAELPPPRADAGDLPADAPSRYRVLSLWTEPEGRARSVPLRVHLYDRGPGHGYTLAGIER